MLRNSRPERQQVLERVTNMAQALEGMVADFESVSPLMRSSDMFILELGAAIGAAEGMLDAVGRVETHTNEHRQLKARLRQMHERLSLLTPWGGP